MLHAVLNAKRAGKDEDSRVQYAALDEGPRGASAAQHARPPVVFGAQVAWSAGRKGLLSVERQRLKLVLRPTNRPRFLGTENLLEKAA